MLVGHIKNVIRFGITNRHVLWITTILFICCTDQCVLIAIGDSKHYAFIGVLHDESIALLKQFRHNNVTAFDHTNAVRCLTL